MTPEQALRRLQFACFNRILADTGLCEEGSSKISHLAFKVAYIIVNDFRVKDLRDWSDLSFEQIAKRAQASRRQVIRAVELLRTRKHLEVESRHEVGQRWAHNRYRIRKVDGDAHDTINGVAHVTGGGDAHVTLSSVSPSEELLKTEKKEEASLLRPQGFASTDKKEKPAAQEVFNEKSGVVVGITQEDVETITSLGEDIVDLLQVFREKTRGKEIRNPGRYLVKMAEDRAAKRTGVSLEAIKRLSHANQGVRAEAMAEACGVRAEACGVSAEPRPDWLAKRRLDWQRRGWDPEQVMAGWHAERHRTGRVFRTALDAEKDLGRVTTNLRFQPYRPAMARHMGALA